jgi:uncharacterized protein involved in exopolysaccharide biosynthesis
MLELSLSGNSIKKTEVIGDVMVSSYPVKPKKRLIVMVAFVTGLILSIFSVFFYNFVRQEEGK